MLLAGGSKGQFRSKKSLLLLLAIKVDQNIFSPETCFAYIISESKFMVWIGHKQTFISLHESDKISKVKLALIASLAVSM